MPVHVGVSLLAAEAEDVDPLRGHRRRQGPSGTMNDSLEGDVLCEREVADDGLPMFDGRDEHVAKQHVEVRQEGDVVVVAEDDVRGELLVSARDAAHEAWPCPYSLDVGLEVEVDPLILGHVLSVARVVAPAQVSDRQ